MSGITADDVIASIEMILGRTPDQGLVDYHVQMGFPDRVALGRYMLGTQEFQDRYHSRLAGSAEPLGFWEARAAAAFARKDRLLSFGGHARAVLASTRHGLFAVDPEDDGVSGALLHHGSYGEEEIAFAGGLISAESDVLIVGTHIGSLLIPLARQCAHVVGIEANPKTFELLEANVRLSGVSNVELHYALVGERDGDRTEFLVNRENSGGSKIMPAHATAGYMYDSPDVIEVPSSRIDTLLGARTFDLIIMDIEGSEIFALRGMPETLKRCKALAVEFRAHCLIEVADIGVDDFIAVVEPLFSWMYIPLSRQLLPIDQAPARLRAMFEARECHDALYFFKNKPDLPDPVGA